MNSRKYPRTLNEAFPHGAAYGCAVTRYQRPGRVAPVWIVLALLLILVGVFA
jgi:hypothetical protein